MRVAMFSRFPRDMNHPKGGVESATVGLANGLVQRSDIDCHIVTLENNIDRDNIESYGAITVHRLQGNNWPMIFDVFGGPGRRKIDNYIAGLNPDIVHFQETYGFGGPHPNLPSVFTVHGFDSLNLVTERKYLWWIRSPLWRLAEKRGISSQEFLISIAPYVTEELMKHTSADITSIPNAINADFFNVSENTVPGRIFFAGWVSKRKNLLSAVKALKLLIDGGTDATLHAAGAFVDDDYLELVRRYIAEAALTPRVRLLGRIGQNELRQELSEAQVFVLPSYQENAPMAIAEAMAAGVPIVTSNVCGMPFMVEEAKAGFLTEPDDIQTISEKLRLLLQDDSLCREIGNYAKRVAERTYHPDSVVKATLDLYERVASDSVE